MDRMAAGSGGGRIDPNDISSVLRGKKKQPIKCNVFFFYFPHQLFRNESKRISIVIIIG